MLRPGSMISSAASRKVLARGADERVEIGADGRRLVGVGVARAEAAAQVVDGELAERSDRRDRLRERLDVEDLRSHVDVQPPHVQARAALDPPDQLGAAAFGASPNFDPSWPGEHVGVRVGRHAGDHAHEHVLCAAAGHRRLEPVDVVGVVDHDEPEPTLHGHLDLLAGLGVAVQDQRRRLRAGLQRGDDLARPGDIEPEALLDHHPLDGRARERLRGEHDTRARPACRELAAVLARSGAQRLLGDHQRRRTELARRGRRRGSRRR